MPKFTSQILLLFSKVLHILEKLLLKNFTGLKVVSWCHRALYSLNFMFHAAVLRFSLMMQ